MNPPPDIGMFPTCALVCATKAPPKVGLDNGMWAFQNWKGPKLLEMFPKDMGINGTILFERKLLDDPIVIGGNPYENGLDSLCVCNSCWAIPPKGIEVEGPSCRVAEGTSYEVAKSDPTIVATEVTIGGTLSEAFTIAIWSKGNILTVLLSWSKSLKLAKSRYGSPTRGVLEFSWFFLGVPSITIE